MRPKARFLMAFPLPLPKRCKGHGKRKQEVPCGDYRLLPRVTKPATVLAAIKDKPFGWPPSGRPSLTAARHGGAIEPRSGRKNGFAEVEQKNVVFGKSHANFSCSS